MTRITIRNFTKAANKSGGIQTIIAERLGVSRAAVSLYVAKTPEAKEILEQEFEKIVDLAENTVFSKISKGDLKASELLLKTKGKTRGYIEKQEIQHDGLENVPIKIIIHNDVKEKEPKTDS